MKIKILAKDIELTEGNRDYIEKKIVSINKYLQKFDQDGDLKCDIEVCKITHHHAHGNVFHASVNLFLPGKTLRAESDGETLRETIDRLKDVLKHEVLKYKERKNKAE